MGMRMSGGGCCCGGECYECLDTFTRDDTTNDATAVGSCFTIFGALTAEISSNVLIVEGADAGAFYNAGLTFCTATLTVEFQSASMGDVTKFRLIFGGDDEDNYHCWEIRAEDDGFGWDYHLELIERVAGVETVIKDEFFRQSPASNPANTFTLASGPNAFTWFYNAATGMAYLTGEFITSGLNQGAVGAYYQFGSPLAGNKFGFGFGDTVDVPVEITYSIIYEPLADGSDEATCFDVLQYNACNFQYGEAPDEVTLTIAGLVQGAGSCDPTALNDTYVLARYDEDAPAYRLGFPTVHDHGGILYRYELPSAICSVKYLDFWLSDNGGGGSVTGLTTNLPKLILANSSEVWLAWIPISRSTDDCSALNETSGTPIRNTMPAPDFSTTGWVSTVTN